MSYSLSFVIIVRDRARIEQLTLIVKEMMELVKSASHFIVDYFSHGRLSMCVQLVEVHRLTFCYV
jgi:hypothetical protein